MQIPVMARIARQLRLLPLVLIARPWSTSSPPTPGASRIITYTDFNVDSHSLVLNNSTTGGTSVLAGSVSANTNLGFTYRHSDPERGHRRQPSPCCSACSKSSAARPMSLSPIRTASPATAAASYTTPRVTLTTGDVSTFDTTGQIKVTGGSVNFGAGNADLSGVTYFDMIAGSIGTSASGGTISGNSNSSHALRGQHLHLQ